MSIPDPDSSHVPRPPVPRPAADPQFRARFEREAKSVSALNHPHICTLHDIGSATVRGEELHYLVLELIEGESLAQRLEKGPLPGEDVLRYGAQIANALDAADPAGKREIWIRPLDALESRPLAGTEGALRPIWSPDSRSIAFMSGRKLRRVAVAGGPAQTIADAPNGADGSWGPQGVILLDGRTSDPFWKIDAGGGVPSRRASRP